MAVAGVDRANLVLGLGAGCFQREVPATPMRGYTWTGLVWAELPTRARAQSSLEGSG